MEVEIAHFCNNNKAEIICNSIAAKNLLIFNSYYNVIIIEQTCAKKGCITS